jgi:arylsulfatase A-like enzyme
VPVSSPEDIVATIAEDFGATPLVTIDGASLRGVLEGKDPNRRCWGGCAAPGRGAGGPQERPACDWIVGRDAGVLYKYIRYPSTAEIELYDLDADPGELVNLADDSPGAVAALDADLNAALGLG